MHCVSSNICLQITKITIDEHFIDTTIMLSFNQLYYMHFFFCWVYLHLTFCVDLLQVFVSSAVTYCDQASWQSRIAAKPIQGVFGFLLGGLIWFAIPSTMATTTGLAYLALSTENNTHMLTHNQIDEGWFICLTLFGTRY